MKVVLTGGGTGGHIYPALSLWRYMQGRVDPLDCLYIGTRNGLEQSIVRPLDLPFVTIEAAGLRRQVSLQAVRTLLITARGYFQARRLLRRFRPDVVVGTGGFVTLLRLRREVPGYSKRDLGRECAARIDQPTLRPSH
ncbi:hypothetical protein GCM10025858_37210 [Alicyclobacillus sacchari]|uniref:glycosyltransferase n=1 Tax=Alicyclobacillus sacchari TaxID=392010 RepID=UPI0023EA0317|nr:glycosyltransferase [Alicyclobacillus sacchari]GMA59218.1 hypothetical protein GCM10025858_37210 [Alicyclobacillus sacchari]